MNRKYNGHPTWAHWNVALWFGNDEGLYRMARDCKSGAELWDRCQEIGYTKTADGAGLSLRLCQYAWNSLKD